MKLFILFLIGILFSFNAYTQKRYLNAGVGIAGIKSQDERMSPLSYTGSSLLAYTGYNEYRDKVNFLTDGFFYVGSISAPGDDGNTGSAFYFKGAIDFRTEWPLTKLMGDNFQFLLGGEWSNFFTTRLHQQYANNTFNYEYVSSLAIAPALQRSFSLFDHRVDLRWQLAIPFIAAVVRPGYVSTQPLAFKTEENGSKAFFESLELNTLNHYFHIKSQISATYHLSNGNAIRLMYLWNYYSYDRVEINEVRNAFQGLFITTLFNF